MAAPPATRSLGQIQAAWAARGPLAMALLPVAALYAAAVMLRRAAFRWGLFSSQRVGVPVVVVGNVIAGGAGKTPSVIAIVEHLRQRGERPGIVSRGYGARLEGERLVSPGDDAGTCGDEPLLMATRARVPVAVGRDRVAAARRLLQHHPDLSVIVSDDGLQHLRLQRDIEVLVFDERGIGNGWWLPAGPLRESAARQADLVLYNAPAPSTPRQGFVARRSLGCAVPLAAWRAGERTGPALAELQGSSVLAVAGVAHPERFFGMLEAAGLGISRCPLPDHHAYTAWPWQGRPEQWVLVTEKDAVKLHGCDDARVHVVALDFELPAEFFTALDRLVDARRPTPRGPHGHPPA